MSSTDPEQIRSEIERTRADLSHNVNTLADSVSPSSVAKRQTDKVKGAVSGARDKVMGAASDAGSGVSAAPGQARAKAAGSPLAAGLIAFGVGWLSSALLPSSTAEQNAASKIKGAATPMLSDTAKEISGNLKDPAQQALSSIKATATDATSVVTDEGTSAAAGLKDEAQGAKDAVTR